MPRDSAIIFNDLNRQAGRGSRRVRQVRASHNCEGARSLVGIDALISAVGSRANETALAQLAVLDFRSFYD
jgi:hypothetical protein